MSPSGTEPGSELDDVDHGRLHAAINGGECVLMPPRLKGPALLLIDETTRTFVVRDRRRHPKRDPEMAGTPGHGIPELHHTAGDSSDRTLARCSIDPVCASTDNERSKQAAAAAAITVSSRIKRTSFRR